MIKKMKFAIPTVNGKITAHFGHCDSFAVVDVEDNKIIILPFFLEITSRKCNINEFGQFLET